MKALTLSADWDPKPGCHPDDEERASRKARSGSQVWRNPILALGDRPIPAIAAGQLLIEVAAVGICGSDLHMAESDGDGYILYPGLTRFPNTLGHEFAGRIVEMGEGVRGFSLGEPVTAEEIHWCGRCNACRQGLVNHCTDMEELGFTTPGAMARFVAIDARYCWSLAELAERMGNSDEALLLGAMVEPSGVAYHAMFNRLGNWTPGATVAVFGAGPIGLAAVALARAAGASLVIAFDPSAARRASAERLGADRALDPDPHQLNEILLELTRGHGIDMVIEAAGAPNRTLSPLTSGLAVGASMVHIGRSERPTALSLEHFQVRGVQLAGSLGHAGHGTFPKVIRLMAAGRLDLRPMVSARMPLAQGPEAFRRLESRADAKIMLLPGGEE